MYIVILVRRNIVLDDDLDDQFRDVVYRRLGYRKGALSEALSQAITAWIKNSSQRSFSKSRKRRKRK